MATTKSTEGSLLNKGYVDGFYSNIYTVTTGNMKDSKGKVVNNKYVSGRIFNDTYTLLDNANVREEGAALADSLTAVRYKGIAELFPEADLDSERWYSVYGCPDKWVYDEHQRYNNCGVDTCLNILSMAGVKRYN